MRVRTKIDNFGSLNSSPAHNWLLSTEEGSPEGGDVMDSELMRT